MAGLSAGVDQLQAMGGGLVMAAGEGLESEGLLNAGRGLYQRNMDEAAENSLGYGFTDLFSNPETSALDWAAYTAGNLLPMMATSIAGGGVGGIGARMLAGAAAKEGAKRAGQALGTYAASTGMEAGNLMGQTGEAGVSLAHASVMGAADALVPVKVLRSLGRNELADKAAREISDGVLGDLRRQAQQGTLRAAGGGLALNLLQEMGTEGLQNLMEQHAVYWSENEGKSLFQNPSDVDLKAMVDEAAAGGLMGGIIGVPAGIGERGQARQQVDRIEAARKETEQQGGDALDQSMAAQGAEQASPIVQEPQDPAVMADAGNRIQLAMDELDELQNLARGSSFQGQTRLRNMGKILDRAEQALENGQVDSAARLAGRAQSIAGSLRIALTRTGSDERPVQSEGEIVDDASRDRLAGLLEQDGWRLPPGDAGTIFAGGPTADTTQYEPQARKVRRDEALAVQRQGAERMREQQANARPQISDQGIVYGDGPVAGNANNGLDQSFERAAFTDTAVGTDAEAARVRQQQNAADVARLARTRGRGETAYLPDNTAIRTRFRVAEAADLRPSNTPDGRVNPGYPAELQPRDRTNANSQVQVRNIAARLNPERLGSSRDAGAGAPIIGSDGVVESGNGRTMAIAQAYRQGSERAGDYRAFVRRQAEALGMDPVAVDEMTSPVLVRERLTSIDRAEFARRANESQVAGMTAYEQALADADSLNGDDVQAWAPDQSGDPLAASNRDFQRVFVQRLGNNEAARYTTRDGQASPELGSRMQRAVFAKAFQDADMVEMATEQGDQMRNLTAALQVAAPDLTIGRETGSQDAGDAIGTIIDAVRIVRQARQDGIGVRELTRQGDAFSEPVPDATALLAVTMQSNLRSRRALTEAMRYIGQAVRTRAENERNGALFEDTTTNEDVFNASFQTEDPAASTEQRSPQADVQQGTSRRQRNTAGGRETEDSQGIAQGQQADALRGQPIDAEWTAFSEASGSRGIPRAEMPQIKAEHRGALANFLSARGIQSNEATVPARSLRPTQREFSEDRVQAAKAREGGDRAILVSADGHVVDGHHQWLARADQGEDVRVIQLDAPIDQVLEAAREFPSSEVNDSTSLLATYDEQALAARDHAQQQAEHAETDRRRQEEDRAQADTEADDFRLSGSDRAADVAAAGGQQDLTDTTDDAAQDDGSAFDSVQQPEQPDEAPKPKRHNKPLIYAGYSGEERSVRSYQELGDYRIAKVNDSLYEVIDPDGQAVSQMAGPQGAAREAERLDGLTETDQRYAIGQSDARPVGREAIEAALVGTPELGDVTVIQSASELPPASLIGMTLQGVNPRDVRGLFVGDQLYVIADNVDSVQEGVRTAVHEAVGHKGMRGVLGADLERVMLSLFRSLPNSKEGRAALAEVRRDYPFLDPSKREDRVTIGEEMVAHLLEKGLRPKAWQRAVAKIRDLLRRLLPSIGWTHTDALALGEKSRQYLRNQKAERRGDNGELYSLRGKERVAFESQFDDFTDADRDAAAKIGARTPPHRAMDWFKEKADRAGLKIRQGMVDRVAALKEIDERLYGESALGENITRSSWVLARMSGAANGALHALLHNGRIKLDAKQKVITLQDGDSKGLGEVLGRLGSAAEIERFMGWIAGNRAARLAQDGRENLFDVGDIEAMKGWNRGQMDDGRSRESVYREVFDEFQAYRDDVLAVAEQGGIISADQRTMWRDEFYVPFYRLAEDNYGQVSGMMATSGLSRQQAYKRLKGGTQNLNDLLQNTMMNFHHLLDASLKNQAAAQAVENAKQLGMVEMVPESNRDTKKSTFVMEGGKKVFYEIDDPLVFEALTALAHPGMNSAMMKVMRGFKRVFTNLTTTTPQFMVANLIRDSLQATATNNVSKNSFKNVIDGAGAYRDQRLRAQMLASGASFNFGHLYGNNPDELRAQLTRNMRDAELVDGPWAVPNVLRKGWAWWNDVNNAAENVNRAAIYSQNRESGELRAAFEARDLIDFSAHGAWPAVRILIDIVPFLNARIQGLDKIYRSGVKPGASVVAEAFGKGKANVTDKQAAGRFWTVSGALAMATVALYLHNQDDEEYQKLEDWQKDTYWFIRFGDNAFFIPKPFEVGAIATMAERITQQFVDDEATGKVFRQRLMHMLTDTFSFSPVPQMAQPALDIYANYDAFTGRPIESMGMDRLSPELRKRAGTSKVGEWISQGLNNTVGAIGDPDKNPLALSPVQVDHLIGGYLGQVGTWVASSGDVAWRANTGIEAPASRWHEYQPIRRFYRDLGEEDRYTRYGTVFYEGLREAGRAYADVKELHEMRRLAEAAEVAESQRDVLALRKPLNRAQRRLSGLNKQIDLIRRSSIDGELKRQRIDRLSAMKNQIQRALGKRVLEARTG
ncbi:LPD38 domain-containing protein [Halomonas sp. V046]|uniref:LPD38 domain-containing protein n=1 Tax=Halomonas sp. V046 TaxID=3459611 RepID=UPI004044CBC2